MYEKENVLSNRSCSYVMDRDHVRTSRAAALAPCLILALVSSSLLVAAVDRHARLMPPPHAHARCHTYAPFRFRTRHTARWFDSSAAGRHTVGLPKLAFPSPTKTRRTCCTGRPPAISSACSPAPPAAAELLTKFREAEQIFLDSIIW
jgi:hypothetical protein